MGDATRRRLRNFEGRTAVPVQGRGAVFVGLLFAGAGTIPLLIGVGMMAWGTQPTRPPGWVVAVAGSVFIIFGLAAFVSGLRGLLYRRRRARTPRGRLLDPFERRRAALLALRGRGGKRPGWISGRASFFPSMRPQRSCSRVHEGAGIRVRVL
ncbi:MAG TPA: hypothetical protein VF611_20685 [Pyrinomonadaceae bacterium]